MGVDPSTSTGIVILEGDKVLVSEAIRFADTDGYTRLHLIAARFAQLVDIYSPDVFNCHRRVRVWQPRFTLVLMVQIGTLIRSKLFMRDKIWFNLPPTSLKKWVAGEAGADRRNIKRLSRPSGGLRPRLQ